MKFSESWLRKFVNPSWDSSELAERLTMAGIEVEALEPVAPAFTGVVVGEVLSAEKHPEADRLKVLKVNVGQEVPLQIVCGASNVVVGMKAPCAVVGALLPGNFKIKEAKLRGVPSFGMMCSEKELGLKEEADGLMVLPSEAPVGLSIRDFLNLDDLLFTLKLTPNRADCLGVLGVAREVAALSAGTLSYPLPQPVASTHLNTPAIVNHAPEACPLYLGRVVQLDHPAMESPQWMVQRLERSGIRSHSLVVDVTNYVLLETGQPLHAFDRDRLTGDLQIRYAKEDETLLLLNDQKASLSQNMLVIADDKEPLALAGIMGGLATAVQSSSRNIFLEAAYFNPESIAGRARVLGLSTDSSHRFERGVDFSFTEIALERATELLLSLSGGQAGDIVRFVGKLPSRITTLVRPSRVQRILGIPVDHNQIVDLLAKLGMDIKTTDAGLEVTPPSYRFDLSIEADYIEEIARLIGYDAIPEIQPVGPLNMLAKQEIHRQDDWFQDTLVLRDYQEVVTYSFIDPDLQSKFAGESKPIPLVNPIASQFSVMRTSIWPGLVQTLQANLAKQAERVRLFEIGRCFVQSQSGSIEQPKRCAGLAYGPRFTEQWGEKGRWVDFYDVKADIETLLQGVIGVSFVPSRQASLHPGRQAEILVQGKAVGYLGEAHPRLVKECDIPGPFILFELDLPALQERQLPAYQEPSKFPQVFRDLAVVVNDNLLVGEILQHLNGHSSPPIKEVFLFDLYRGPGVSSGKKSLAFRIVMQDTEKTLTDNDIDKAVSSILNQLQTLFHAELR